MAVQARKQFLYCKNDGDDGPAVGWVDNRGQLPVDLCRRPLQQQQQQRQIVTTTACASALASQQQGPVACSRQPPLSMVFLPAEFPCFLASQIDEQKREVDQFLCLQSERLRMALQQQMKHHLVSLMKTLEAKATTMLRHKEEELARASKMAAELEERLRQSEAESLAWQRAARENEAMALALSSALEHVRDSSILDPASPPNPAASCCNSSSDPPPGCGRGGTAEPWRQQGEAMARWCRACRVEDSRVLFLPCMHLCACELCGALLPACPVCGCAKQGSVEVFFS